MAIPPTIPTSFVPNPASSSPRRFRSDFTGAFGFFAYAVLGIVFVLAIGVFFYGRILSADKSSKDEKILAVEASIDSKTVESFVRLRDRLTFGKALLGKHVAFSGFFSLLEKILPETVRFTVLHLSVDSTGASTVEGTGIAKNFNSLASASAAFASNDSIKDAIFSDIAINKDNSVTFTLSASIDSGVVAFSP